MQGNDIQVRLAENIKKIRKEKKLTQFELAEKANLSEGMIKSIETCHVWPSENSLQQISVALETDIYHFFMPVSSSFHIRQEIQAELRQAVTQSYRDYLNEMMETLEQN